jgi:3-oxoacyl-[acyl-carrier protein] reductase
MRDEPVIHSLINCAGHVNPKPFLDCTQEDWLLELNVNLLGTAYFCQAVAPIMVRAGYGRIVNVASLRGETITAAARGVAYSAAKAGVINLTAALAKEFAPTINVNAVAPGFIHTDMSENWNETVWDQARSALVGRVGRPEDIGEVLAFLASRRAAFVTGQTIVADGGYTMAGK